MKRVSRSEFVQRLTASSDRLVQGLGAFVRDGDGSGKIVCWGGAAEWAAPRFETRAVREALWNTLVDIGDPRGMLLFMYLFQSVQDARQLVQRDARDLSPVLRLAAQALGDTPSEEAREVLNSQARKLMAVGYVVADRVPPQRESTRRP